MRKIIISGLILLAAHKQQIFAALGIIATIETTAQVSNGGSMVNMGNLPSFVLDLSLIPSPRPVGLEVVCLCDSMKHIWDGVKWHTNLDSARIVMMGYITAATAATLFDGKTTWPNTTLKYRTGYGTFGSLQDRVLANTGISAGTYGRLTVNTKGLATAGKREELYTGTTNGSGDYTVTFATAYGATPNIQANIVGGTDLQRSTITALSTTGFTVHVVQQNTTNVALVGLVLVPGTAAVSGSTVHVIISEN